MVRRIRIISFAFAVCALALCGADRLRAQSADLVLCDRIAADPADPEKPKDIPGVVAIAKPDIPLALKYCKIASASSRRALFELGRAYAANGQMTEAIATYRKAADKGSTSAMIELGVLYGTGAGGVPKNPDEARKLFDRAAKAGNPRGASNLAAMSSGGVGAPADPAVARAMLAKAAAENSAEAQFQLGLMLADGTGGPKDDVQARGMFEKAAAQGNAEAMVWAGAFAQLGRGGPEDVNAAKTYFEKAAALGNQEAKDRLERIRCPLVVKDSQGKVVTHLCP